MSPLRPRRQRAAAPPSLSVRGGIEADATSPPAGLGSEEAARRPGRDGPNSMPNAGRRPWRRIAADTAREPMSLSMSMLLAGAAMLYLLLGKPR